MSNFNSSIRVGRSNFARTLGACALVALGACGGSNGKTIHDPSTASVVSVDRFSAQAGTLQVRDASNGLPAANAPVDFDQGPFITQGLGPAGEVVKYYNFDVKPAMTAPIYALFEAGASAPVAGQLNIIDVIPGDAGYNDFWQVMKVTVPAGYVANTVASLAEIQAAGYPIASTDMIVNCPVVPAGSTASLRLDGGATGLSQGWYRGQVVDYFNFVEAQLTAANDAVPVSPILVDLQRQSRSAERRAAVGVRDRNRLDADPQRGRHPPR